MTDLDVSLNDKLETGDSCMTRSGAHTRPGSRCAGAAQGETDSRAWQQSPEAAERSAGAACHIALLQAPLVLHMVV